VLTRVTFCVLFSTSITIATTPLLRTHAATGSLRSQVRNELITLINQDRAAHHAAPLALDAAQSKCSLKHAEHMAAQDYISHDDFPSDVCTPHVYTGENVGMEPGDPMAGAAELDRLMMAEGPCPHKGCPGGEFEQHGHYLNIISRRYTRVGIGVYIARGDVWITEDFTDGRTLR
jgi:uncharacterized protein YkwD